MHYKSIQKLHFKQFIGINLINIKLHMLWIYIINIAHTGIPYLLFVYTRNKTKDHVPSYDCIECDHIKEIPYNKKGV